MAKIHFVGIGGSGMSALAQLHAMAGDTVSGSDRYLDGGNTELGVWRKLKDLKITLLPQDGSGITPDLESAVFSSAIEKTNPDYKRCAELGIKMVHRSELLAAHAADFDTVAVAGTSGKSTVTAMIFEILAAAGKDPSVINGAPLLSLAARGYYGNVYLGKSRLMVMEADESDGTIVNYKPRRGLLLNMSRDHKAMSVIEDYFRRFKANCGGFIVNADEANLKGFFEGSLTFGFKNGKLRGMNLKTDGFGSTFTLDGVEFKIPVPGLYNAQNALAAVAVCRSLDVSLEDCSAALAHFGGVYRRFNSMGSVAGVEVIDDFAHNPAKIAAALSAAKLRGKRVIAVYQPHGFAPVRMFKDELIESFYSALGENDTVIFPEIYYAGGTTDKTISSDYLARGLAAKGRRAYFEPCKDKIPARVSSMAQSGDVVLVMGARDPNLPEFAKQILGTIKTK